MASGSRRNVAAQPMARAATWKWWRAAPQLIVCSATGSATDRRRWWSAYRSTPSGRSRQAHGWVLWTLGRGTPATPADDRVRSAWSRWGSWCPPSASCVRIRDEGPGRAGRWDSPRVVGGAASVAGMTIRVFLLDDHEIVRRGINELLDGEDDIEVVGESGLAEEATRRIPALRPDVAILDARLPDGSGIDVCREVRSQDPTHQGPDPHVVRRRRGAVRRDHGRRGRLHAQAGQGQRPRRRRAHGWPPASRCSTRR